MVEEREIGTRTLCQVLLMAKYLLSSNAIPSRIIYCRMDFIHAAILSVTACERFKIILTDKYKDCSDFSSQPLRKAVLLSNKEIPSTVQQSLQKTTDWSLPNSSNYPRFSPLPNEDNIPHAPCPFKQFDSSFVSVSACGYNTICFPDVIVLMISPQT